MKKIQDIKIRSKNPYQVKENFEDDASPNEFFWENLQEKPKSKNRNHSAIFKLSLKIFAITSIVFSLALFSYAKAMDTLSSVESSLGNFKYHLSEFLDAEKSGQYDRSISEATLAEIEIKKIRLELQSWGQDSAYLQLIQNKKSKIVENEMLVDIGDSLLSAYLDSNKIVKTAFNLDSLKKSLTGSSSSSEPIISPEIYDYLLSSSEKLKEAKNKLNQISEFNFSGDLKKSDITFLIDKSLTSVQFLEDKLLPSINWITGTKDGPKKIIVLFQNNAELRGTGGFIGSFAILDFKDGSLNKISFETNIYKLDKTFTSKNLITPPKELKDFTSPWSLRDSNFAVNGPESFQKVLEFYQKETGENADGIISLDTTLFTNLLGLTGPITLPDLKMVINKDNFLETVEYEVEKGYFEREGGKEENEPKKILAQMMPIFTEKLAEKIKDVNNLKISLKIFENALKQKNLIFYFNNSTVESIVEQKNYAAKIDTSPHHDYIYLHSTNIGGMKSSLNISQTLSDNITIGKTGQVDHQITLKRDHQGSGRWPDGTNINLIRFYAPSDSKNISVSPLAGNFWPHFDQKYAGDPLFYLQKENDRQKTSFWFNVKAKETGSARITYKSGFSIDSSLSEPTYSLLLQKQPGANPDKININIYYPENLEPVNSTGVDSNKRKITLDFSLNEDSLVKVKFIQK